MFLTVSPFCFDTVDWGHQETPSAAISEVS